MSFYTPDAKGFQTRPVIVSFLFTVFIVGCVGVQQDESRSTYMGSKDLSNGGNINLFAVTNQSWQGGDIIYAANGYTDHMAMVDDNTYGTDNMPDIIDADGNGLIRRHNNFSRWVDQGGWTSIDGYYVAIVKSSTDFNKIPAITFDAGSVFSAQADISPLNILYKRNTPSNAHSSQLVREAYQYLYNIDLDAGSDWWSFPKDVLNNSNLIAKSQVSVARS